MSAVIGGAAFSFFVMGAVTGSIIEDHKTQTVEIDGHVYDDCHRVASHTLECV